MAQKSSKAGTLVREEDLIRIPNLINLYYLFKPNMNLEAQRVRFGTSGHRGSSLKSTFTESHILAITQAICDYRRSKGYSGPLFIGKDTHALSDSAQETALEVLAANDVQTRIAHRDHEFTPTPVISHAILCENLGKERSLADGIIITPSHNPPSHGGIKYNPPHGGPADISVTSWIADRANDLLQNDLNEAQHLPYAQSIQKPCIQDHDYVTPYVEDLKNVVDMEAIGKAELRICADALGGAGGDYWPVIAETYGLDITVLNGRYDPTYGFMTYDRDGEIRMDCSSADAMAGLIEHKDEYDIDFGNDPDFDRHGIVTPNAGLMNPNHYLAVAIDYLFTHRSDWPPQAAVGKTLVSSTMIDRVAQRLNRPLKEVPVGFKWFVDELREGRMGFAGEESAGASFLRMDGSVWTTDKDGIILCLLAAEIMAVTGQGPGMRYLELVKEFGEPIYKREESPATLKERRKIRQMNTSNITTETVAGEPITHVLTEAPGNAAPIGGLKVTTENGWFAARASGTEDIYKIYAESFNGAEHVSQIMDEAKEVVAQALQR